MVVLGDPKKRYLTYYVQYLMGHLPDMTDEIKFKLNDLQFWMKTDKITPKGPHKQSVGIHGKWTHSGVDFAISECHHYKKGKNKRDMIKWVNNAVDFTMSSS